LVVTPKPATATDGCSVAPSARHLVSIIDKMATKAIPQQATNGSVDFAYGQEVCDPLNRPCQEFNKFP